MAEVFRETSIAAGYNNAGGLTNIEEITDADGIRLNPLFDFGVWRDGSPIIKGGGIVGDQGFQSFDLTSEFITWSGIKTVKDTYLSGNRSGQVTVRVAEELPGTYANYNAVLTLQQLADTEYKGNGCRIIWQFTFVQAI